MATTAGITANPTSVRGSDNMSMTPTVRKIFSTDPSVSGSIASIPWMPCRSEIDRETTWPVRTRSCAGPSSACNAVSKRTRRSCCTSSDSTPAVKRRTTCTRKRATPTPTNTAMTAANGAMPENTDADAPPSPWPVATSMASRVSSGVMVSRTVSSTVDATTAASGPGCRRQERQMARAGRLGDVAAESDI